MPFEDAPPTPDLEALLAALEATSRNSPFEAMAAQLRAQGITPRPGRLRITQAGDVSARIIIISDDGEEEQGNPAPTHCPTCGQALP